MKISKVLLLLLFFALAVFGVLLFAKTRVAPPNVVLNQNQYVLSLTKECGTFVSITDYKQCKTEYVKIEDRISRFYKEKKLDAKYADSFRSQINSFYGSVLVKHGYNLFKQSSWNKQTIDELCQSLKELEADKLISGKVAVEKQFLSDSKKLQEINKNYSSALTLVNSKYENFADAQKKIQEANKYKQDIYLKNNSDLITKLNNLPWRLAVGHYRKVREEIFKLINYHQFSEEEYNKLVGRAHQMEDEYNKATVYGTKPDISSLKNDTLGNILTHAFLYFHP